VNSGLLALGYAVESGKSRAAKISRPVLFGENRAPSVSYEIDAFHDRLGIAVEVEAGRGAAKNADYRDTGLGEVATRLGLTEPGGSLESAALAVRHWLEAEGESS
jgi:hypothetical protein